MSSRCLVVAVFVLNAVSSQVFALDYHIDRSFTKPAGQVVESDKPQGELVYNSKNGHLVYRPEDVWFPPDLASYRGLLIEDAFNGHVPLIGFPPADLTIPFPGEVQLAGELVPGSNSIFVGSDGGLEYWPYSESEMLELWGLSHRPTEYDYGSVLPVGLSQEELAGDLFSFPLMTLTVVVPEPPSAVMVSLPLLLLALCYRSLRRRSSDVYPR